MWACPGPTKGWAVVVGRRNVVLFRLLFHRAERSSLKGVMRLRLPGSLSTYHEDAARSLGLTNAFQDAAEPRGDVCLAKLSSRRRAWSTT